MSRLATAARARPRTRAGVAGSTPSSRRRRPRERVASAGACRPRVRTSVVVPFRDGAVLLARCLASVLDRATPPGFEVVLVDNGSVEAETAALVDRWVRDTRVRLVPAPGSFNFSALVNAGAAVAQGDVLCLLTATSRRSMTRGSRRCSSRRSGRRLGAVGAKLLYADDSIQHAGIALGRPARSTSTGSPRPPRPVTSRDSRSFGRSAR